MKMIRLGGEVLSRVGEAITIRLLYVFGRTRYDNLFEWPHSTLRDGFIDAL
jgi:hypothetical protein